MAFLSPLFLFGALAAAVPIVLHLLKRDPETRVRFSAVHLLRHAPVEHSSRRRLRELLLVPHGYQLRLNTYQPLRRQMVPARDAQSDGDTDRMRALHKIDLRRSVCDEWGHEQRVGLA